MVDLAAWQMTPIHPNQRQCYCLLRYIGHSLSQQLFVVAVGLSQLPFYAIAVDSMFEMSLRHADDDACLRLPRLSLHGCEDHP